MAKKGDEIRKAKDFLPEYSDFYFEKRKGSLFVYIVLLAIAGGIIGFMTSAIVHDSRLVLKTELYIFLGLVIFGILRKVSTFGKYKKGTILGENETIRKTYNNKEIKVPYSEWKESFKKGNYRFNRESYEFRCRGEILRFHFEVGDSKAQKHIGECYKKFEEKIGEKLPKLTSAEIGLFDRKYFYTKKYRNTCISLGIVFGIGMAILAGGENIRIPVAIIYGLVNTGLFVSLLSNSKLYYKNAVKLNIAFKEFNKGNVSFKWGGFIATGIIIFLQYLANWGMVNIIL